MTNAIAEVLPPAVASPRGVLRSFIGSVQQVMGAKREAEAALKEKSSECKSARLQI